MPAQTTIYKILAEGNGLERDDTLRLVSGASLPTEQKIIIEIQIEHKYLGPEAERNNAEKLTELVNRRLAEIEGFRVLDETNRYEITFPKPPDAKSSRKASDAKP